MNIMSEIPLSVPSIEGNEWKYIKECLDTEWVSSAGKYVDLFEEKIQEYTGSRFAIACVNGTSALQMSLRLAGSQGGDEVLISSLTFIASVNAISYNNLKPVFMDVDSFYNLDAEKTVEFIKKETIFKNGVTYNKKTKNKISAIIPVHVWGNACQFEDLIELCKKQNIAVVEDACESLGTFYSKSKFSGKYPGTIGKLGCLSFNGNKIITTGGGGMILTDDEQLYEKAKYLSTQAKDDPVRYVHNEVGYNFRLTNIQAALGVAQLERLPEILKRKKEIHNFYQTNIKNIEGLRTSKTPGYAENNHWLNLLRIDSKAHNQDREQVMKKLAQKGIQTRPVWRLNHEQKPYKNCQHYKIENAQTLVRESLCLPSSSNISDEDLVKVYNVLNA